MKHPADPREILHATERAIRVPVAPGKADAFDPVTNEKKAIDFHSIVIRILDTKTHDVDKIAHKIPIAPGVWIVVALLDANNNESWLEK